MDPNDDRCHLGQSVAVGGCLGQSVAVGGRLGQSVAVGGHLGQSVAVGCGNRTRQKGNCRSQTLTRYSDPLWRQEIAEVKSLSDIVTHFGDRADHDIRLVSNSD
jgi:hypothetical protein